MKTIKPPYWRGINHSHPLARGLILCLPCNEGNGDRLNDLSGNANHGTLFEDTVFSHGKHGFSLEFDGNDYTVISNSDKLDIIDEISIVTWVRVDAAYVGTLLNRYWNNNDEGWKLFMSSTKFGFAHSDTAGDGNAEAIYCDNTYTFGQWYHVVGLYDGTNHALYVNGIEKKEVATYGIRNTEQAIMLGATKNANGSYGYFLSGALESVLLYNRALSAKEIEWLYREPFAYYR